MMNSRVRYLIYLAYSLIVAGIGLLDNRLVVLAVPLLVYLALAQYSNRPEPDLQCERQLTDSTVRVGGETAVTLTITNQGQHLEEVLIEDYLPSALAVQEGDSQILTPLLPGQTQTLHYTLSGSRGTFKLPAVQITTSETFGLFVQQTNLSAPAQLAVIPTYQRLRHVPVRALRTLGFTGPIPSRQGGAGVDFFGVRQYQPGDPFRRVNWRAMARYGDIPYTTEFEQERITDIGLILDVRRKALPAFAHTSLLEHSVEATAALADALLRDGHRLGLLLYGQAVEWIFPGYGKMQRERTLRALAGASLSDSQVFASLRYLPTRLFPSRSQLIFVSPLLAGDETMLLRLRALGYAVLVISPDPVQFESSHLPPDSLLPTAQQLAQIERRLFLRRLRQGGIMVVNWPVDRSLDEMIQASVVSGPPGRVMRVVGL
ncbi:MAG: DUF58 domain-containing protein [Chloroflexota bacterium]